MTLPMVLALWAPLVLVHFLNLVLQAFWPVCEIPFNKFLLRLAIVVYHRPEVVSFGGCLRMGNGEPLQKER